jgi:hypothetical protein
MPGPGRLLKALMDLFPGFGPTMNRISGGEKFMGIVADHREEHHRATLRRETASMLGSAPEPVDHEAGRVRQGTNRR